LRLQSNCPDSASSESHPTERRTPLVTIGVPVFNGAASLRQALDSLLAQTLGDFELLLADNASTDDTAEICREYARCDHRVRVHRHPRNLGVGRNWNFVAARARGRYFKWASASDVCAPTLLERCVAALEDDPTLVLCFPRTQFVADDGRPVAICEADFEVMASRAHERFAEVWSRMTVNNAQSGVIRSAALAQTRLDRLYPHGDLVLMAELALHGRFRLLPDVLLFRRADRAHWTAGRSPLELERMFVPEATRARRLLRWRRHADYLFSALRAPIPLKERLSATAFVARQAYWLRRELLAEARQLLSPRPRGAPP
jgi:glycosyltransferase involved in cell wall biosynthesis